MTNKKYNLDKPNFIILLVLVFLTALLGGFYLGKIIDKEKVIIAEDILTIDSADKKSMLVKNDFIMAMPADWQEVPTTTKEVVAMMVNEQEEITNWRLKEMDFKTYAAVSREPLYGRSLARFVYDYKKTLRDNLPWVNFSLERTGLINGQDSITMEVRIYQNNAYFKVLVAFVKGKDDQMWTVTFNTADSNWLKYRDLFYLTAGSFMLK